MDPISIPCVEFKVLGTLDDRKGEEGVSVRLDADPELCGSLEFPTVLDFVIVGLRLPSSSESVSRAVTKVFAAAVSASECLASLS